MKIDILRAVFTYVVVMMVLVGGFYSLVLYPYDLDQLVKGSIITFMGAAITFVFSQEVAKTTANATTKALHTPAPGIAGGTDSRPPRVRSMLDGSPCWCVSDEPPHDGWIHSPVCEALRSMS